MEQPSSKVSFNMRQASANLNAPAYLIRRFCRAGLVPHLKHSRAGRLLFTSAQIEWLRTLLGLYNTGMKILELKKYVRLCRTGHKTVPERKALLETQKRQLWQQLEDIQAGINFIERKVEIFDQIITGQIETPKEWI